MLRYLMKYPDKITEVFITHLVITMEALLLSIAMAAVIGALILVHKGFVKLTAALFGAVYCIPSLALFALFIPAFGLGNKTALVVLVLYNQFFLVQSFLGGLESIPGHIPEAAAGMGLSKIQILYRIQLPLAVPVILAGIRMAAISTVGIAVIAAGINAGGLGVLLFEGMRTRNTVKILWGVILAALLNLLLNGILSLLESYSRRKLHLI